MKKAAIYARYSSENQRDESIDAQIFAIEEYVPAFCGLPEASSEPVPEGA